MLGVLHTWSRRLTFHPHVHFLVPGGGLSPDGRSWIPARKNYLLNLKALGARFRTLFQQRLQEEDPELFDRVPAKVWRRRWVVDCRPVGSGEHALTYLSRDIFKSATGDRDVIVLPDGRVRWPYRRSDTGGQASIDLEPHQLISRFLQHGLPRGFHRVRLFGWLHPAARRRANRVRALLRLKPVLCDEEIATWKSPFARDEPQIEEALNSARAKSAVPVCCRCRKPMILLAEWKPGALPPLPLRCRCP